MTIYIFIFVILAQIAVLMELRLTKGARLTLFVFAYFLLVVFVGLRWETGNDWTDYYRQYIHIPSPPEQYATFEIGYKAMTFFTHALGFPFWGFNTIYAMIYLGLIFLSFKHENFRVSGWLVLQLYAPVLIGLMGTMRQAMAIAICMFSVRYLLSRSLLKFLLCVLIATAFHISALAFLLAWPLARFRLNLRRVLIIAVIVVFASIFNVGGAVYKLAEQRFVALQVVDLASHLQLEEESSTAQFNYASPAAAILPTIERVSLLALFIVCFRFFSTESDQLYFKFYFLSIIIVTLLSSTAFVLGERVSLYFSLFQIHLLAVLTQRLRIPAARNLCCAMLLLISLTRLWTSTHLSRPQIFLPYKAVFINQDVYRNPGWFY